LSELLLETANPNDLTPTELHELGGLLQPQVPQVKVLVAYEDQRGAGVTFHDVLHLWLPDPEFFRDAVYSYLIAQCMQFMKRRRSRKHAEGRPISIVVHAPDGTEMAIVSDPPNETDTAQQKKRKSRRRRPPARTDADESTKE
jgi:hypothetical protein